MLTDLHTRINFSIDKSMFYASCSDRPDQSKGVLKKMGADHAVVEQMSYKQPLAFGLSLNHQYSPFRDALKKSLHFQSQEPVYSQQYIGCFSYLSYHGHCDVHSYSFEPAFIHKRNERERQRVRCVNEGYARLREHLPQEFEDKRLSKVETLRAAISYIKHLQNLLEVSLPVGMRNLSPEQGREREFNSDEEY